MLFGHLWLLSLSEVSERTTFCVLLTRCEGKNHDFVLNFDMVWDFIGVTVLVCSVKLVEQELWQKEEKGLIGVLPVQDSDAAAVDSLLSPGAIKDCTFWYTNKFFGMICLCLIRLLLFI
jgi:hypothetical protein